jgi:hypothetical protein
VQALPYSVAQSENSLPPATRMHISSFFRTMHRESERIANMHVKCQREMVEKKRRGVPNGAVNSVKLTETANTVDSLAVQADFLGRPANIQAWLR